MEGWNGGRGSSWSYRQETIESNISSSRSGTIASRPSSAYASSGSRFSSFSMEAAMHFDSLGIHGDVNGNNMDEWEEAEEERITSLRILVQYFFRAPSANCSIKRGDMSVVERWLKELGVGWVLNLDEAAGGEFDRDAPSWIRALDQIMQTICFKRPLFPDRANLPTICEEQGKHVGVRCIADRYHLALFIQETMLKILAFVDVVVAWHTNMTEDFLCMDRVMLLPLPYTYTKKLFKLLGVHDALSEASNKISGLFDSPTSVEVKRIEHEIAILLLAYKNKLGEAIRSTMEMIRTKSMEDGDDSSSPQGSSDIHKVTRSVMIYMELLENSSSLVNAAIQGHVPCTGNIEPLDNMIVEMVSSLQEKLVNISESFPDQGLRFLFLLNNSYFLLNSQCSYRLSWLPVDLNDQTRDYMERYLQVSWAPLLSCLFNPMPLCLGKNNSPLSKFEFEFDKIYTTQKQWKVPDPWLRRRLRKLITNRIIPVCTEYIEDNKVTNPKFSPQELEEMLQELFEG